MKKQFLILATTTMIVLISCSKEKIETAQPEHSIEKPTEEIATNSQRTGLSTAVNLNRGLLGLFEFNGNMKEKNGKLPAGHTNDDSPAFYTTDRNGLRGKAIKMTGNYRVTLDEILRSPSMSLVAWVKYDSSFQTLCNFIFGGADALRFSQAFNKFSASNSATGIPSIASDPIDNSWHHLVATTDGGNLKFYIDGNLINTILSPDFQQTVLTYYIIGHGSVLGPDANWHGAVDDLRFYDRAINAAEVKALFNL